MLLVSTISCFPKTKIKKKKKNVCFFYWIFSHKQIFALSQNFKSNTQFTILIKKITKYLLYFAIEKHYEDYYDDPRYLALHSGHSGHSEYFPEH